MEQLQQIDDRLKELNEQTRILREKRTQLEAHIINNRMTSNKYTIVDAKHTEPLTFKYLERSLREIIRNDSQFQQIFDHIKKRRNVTMVKELKRVDK